MARVLRPRDTKEQAKASSAPYSTPISKKPEALPLPTHCFSDQHTNSIRTRPIDWEYHESDYYSSCNECSMVWDKLDLHHCCCCELKLCEECFNEESAKEEELGRAFTSHSETREIPASILQRGLIKLKSLSAASFIPDTLWHIDNKATYHICRKCVANALEEAVRCFSSLLSESYSRGVLSGIIDQAHRNTISNPGCYMEILRYQD